jgi:hypothetical protein
VYVAASSPNGIARVSADLDGSPFGTLTSHNGCNQDCSGPSYQFTVDGWNGSDASQMTDHEMTITAVDERGDSRRITVPLRVINPPVLNVSSPEEGAFFHGTLKVAGNWTTDTGGIATVTVTLGNAQLLQTTARSFGTNFDLAGTTPGRHRLTIRAVDGGTNRETTVTRNVIVASSRATVLEPSFRLEGGMLSVDGDRVLYRAPDDKVRVLDTVTGAEILLKDTADLRYGRAWQLAGSWAYTHDQGDDCDPYNFVCVYQWNADGSRRNLSRENPAAKAPTQFVSVYQNNPVAHGDKVIWTNDGANSYTLYDSTSGAYTVITPPAEVNRGGNTQYDFTVADGVVTFFYWGRTSVGFPTTEEVYRWRSDTLTSVRLSNPGHESLYPQTDGVRVAWQEGRLDSDAVILWTQPVAGGMSTAMASALAGFELKDGVLAWGVQTPRPPGAPPTPPIVHASTPTTVTVLSDKAGIYDVTGGHVLYSEQGKLYDWNSGTGATTLMLDAPPTSLMASGKTVYLRMGDDEVGAAGPIYKVTLQ